MNSKLKIGLIVCGGLLLASGTVFGLTVAFKPESPKVEENTSTSDSKSDKHKSKDEDTKTETTNSDKQDDPKLNEESVNDSNSKTEPKRNGSFDKVDGEFKGDQLDSPDNDHISEKLKDDSKYEGKNEHHKEGITRKENGDYTVKNKDTKNEKVTISKADIDSDRQALNDAGLPGDAYSETDLIELRLFANEKSLDIVAAAQIGK